MKLTIYRYDLKKISVPPLPSISFLPEVEGSSVFTFSVCFSVCMFDYNVFTTLEQPFASSAPSVCLGFVHLISCTLILLNLLQSEQAPMCMKD